MTFNEYCSYITHPLAEAKARVVTAPPKKWSALRLFYKERGALEVRLSDLVKEAAWLPMPDEIFRRMRETMVLQTVGTEPLLLLGVPGYLALLTEGNKRAAFAALREWVDASTGRETVCLLRSDDGSAQMLQAVFTNPRYRQGKQLIAIDTEKATSQFEPGRTEVMLVGDELASFIPAICDTFQKYLRHAEEHPGDRSLRRIVVASEGRELAGLSAEVRQVMCLKDFARVFYNVEDMGLSENALRWMCERGKEGIEKTLLETLTAVFFPEAEITKYVLRVFDDRHGAERETLLWLLKHIAPKGSYLERIVSSKEVVVDNFRSAYIVGATQCLDESNIYAMERQKAILESGITNSGADIIQFIARCEDGSTSQVAPWLNCRTDAERAEILRRCAKDGFVSHAVRTVYPEVAAYLNADTVFHDETLAEYFEEYRELKITDRLTPEFFEKAQQMLPPSSVQSRRAIVQRYASDNECALLMVDAMGAEWLPMLIKLAQQRNIGVDSVMVGQAFLPTSTQFNSIHWPDDTRRLPDIKRLDNIAHNGVEAHEARRPAENLAAALDVIGNEVLPRVAEGLVRFERVLVTADHGSSRLALLAWQSEPRLAQTLACEADAELADWRYRERAKHGKCPLEMEETFDGAHWVVRGYNRLPKKGGGQGFEQHGGATLEERLVPIVIFSRAGQFVPKAKISGKHRQIIEKDDFDL